jgi:hypothetical protein
MQSLGTKVSQLEDGNMARSNMTMLVPLPTGLTGDAGEDQAGDHRVAVEVKVVVVVVVVVKLARKSRDHLLQLSHLKLRDKPLLILTS